MNGSCYSMMDWCVMYQNEGCWVKERGRMIQLMNDLLEKKNYADLKKSIWLTIRRDCHKPAPRADNSTELD